MGRAAVVGLVLLALSLPATAGAETHDIGIAWVMGTALERSCHSVKAADRGACIGFVAAVAGIVANEAVNGFKACVPLAVDQYQLQAVATKWLGDNPDQLHLSASHLVAVALAEAFPCGPLKPK